MEAASEVFFCGDNHGQFGHIVDAVRTYRPAAIFLLGDIEPPATLDELLAPIASLTTIRWIHGNHCTDQPAYAERGVFDPRMNLHARVEEVAGMRVAGLGGVFRGEIWYPVRGDRRLPAELSVRPAYHAYGDFAATVADGQPTSAARLLKHRSSIFPADIEQLASLRADVLITHEAPSCHPQGFAVIDALARRLGARRVFNGHQHDCRDYRAHTARLGFQAFGVGFCGISDGAGSSIVRGLFDDARHRGRPYPKVE